MAGAFEIDLDHISFAEWLVMLDQCALEAGYRSSPSPIDNIGLFDWYNYYLQNLSPQQAFETVVLKCTHPD